MVKTKLYTLEEAGVMIGVSAATVRKWIKEGSMVGNDVGKGAAVKYKVTMKQIKAATDRKKGGITRWAI